ncbi:MAG: amidohydrolase [Treponema sp.]|jgi:predicted amidohydrolase YtcJ|nr:amidohydrolase [Treponema sp.]
MIRAIYNGKIYKSREKFCEAIIIEGGRIAAAGSSREILEATPAGADKIDAGGALVLPAFNDSHLHLMWAGRRAGCIEGTGAGSIEEVVRRGREYVARNKPPRGTYVQGDGINPDFFSAGEKRDLNREDLDKISCEHPVILSRHCGHTIYCNSLALRLAGFGDSAPEVENGIIEKDKSGRPTGVVRESANALIRKPMPPPSKDDMKQWLRLAMKKAHSLGISACGSYDADGPDFEGIVGAYLAIYGEARAAGVPGLRVSMQCGISASDDILDEYLKRKKGFTTEKHGEESSRVNHYRWEDPAWGSFLKMGAVKLFGDGTLGAQTAWMRHPYRDKPETRGVPVLDGQTLTRFVQKASAGGMQVLVHAIGDAGIDSAISAFETVSSAGSNPLRHGIIHCQITSRDLLERMARNKILALVQPVFLADDIGILERRVGPRLAATSYAWGSMRKMGIPASYSTDAPVSSLDPLLCIEWAVLRNGFCPGEQVDIYAAVDAYTEASAFSAFDEHNLGRIASGYLADLAFLDRDIFAIAPEDIHKAKVLRTMCAGETVHEA